MLKVIYILITNFNDTYYARTKIKHLFYFSNDIFRHDYIYFRYIKVDIS